MIHLKLYDANNIATAACNAEYPVDQMTVKPNFVDCPDCLGVLDQIKSAEWVGAMGGTS